MSRQAASPAWYRFRATFSRRRGGYLALVLFVGLVGGLAMGAIATARRTQSSYPAFLASTNPSDLSLGTGNYDPDHGAPTGYDPVIVDAIRRLPHVKHVESFAELDAYPLNPDGSWINLSVPVLGSVDGLYFDQDRITVTKGRMANPERTDEIVMSADIAEHFRLHPGSIIPWGFYDNAENPEPGIPAPTQRPHLRIDLHVVGIAVFNNSVVADDIDSGHSMFVLFTPALTRQLTECCTQNSNSSLQLDHGTRDVAAVEASLESLHSGSTAHADIPSIGAAKTERAIKPESIALGVFGLIAALATLLIAGQLIGRLLRSGADELTVLRALGSTPAMAAADGLVGIIGAIVAGSLLAAGVAIALSPLAPIGPVRPLYPTRGIAFDWTVLGGGIFVLVGALSAVGVLFAFRNAPHRVARRSRSVRPRRSVAARTAAAAGLPVPVVTGLLFGLEPGGGRNRVPMRSAILGATLALGVAITTLTFGTSLHALVSRPPLYGWNWTYELGGGGGVGAIPEEKSGALLDADHDVAAWSSIYFASYQLDGQKVPVLGARPNAKVGPPILSGHALESAHEVVLGAITLAHLHKHVGDTVRVTMGSTTSTELRVVGTATMPTIGVGGSGSGHPTMGEGALLSDELMPEADKDLVGNVPTGPEAILVRLKPSADNASSRRALDKIAADLTLPSNYGVEVISVQRPAEIINYRSMTTTPLYLGAVLAAGAVAALALTLMASVRRRRHDLALLKTLGFTRAQLRAVVACQSTIAVGIGTVIGVPLGIFAGRMLWDLFANEIHAVPRPIVPTATVALIAVGALLVANLVAAIPARTAANTSTTLLLRAD